MFSSSIREAWKVLVWIVVANSAAFVAASAWLGGDASSGKVDGEHYFLSSHGHYVETSVEIYRYSLLHAYSVVVTWIVIILPAIVYSLWTKWKRRRL